jgi:hypothetical protein
MPYTAKYIATTDITDSLAYAFIAGTDSRLDTWMTNLDLEIESIAQEKGISPTLIEKTPLHYKIKEYATSYYCYLIFQDCFGENNTQINVDQEIYKVKLEYYLQKCNFLRPLLTKEMFYIEGTSLTPSDRISGGQIWV